MKKSKKKLNRVHRQLSRWVFRQRMERDMYIAMNAVSLEQRGLISQMIGKGD